MPSEATKVSQGAIKSLLDLDATKHADPSQQPDNVVFVNRFSKSEVKTYLNDLYVRPDTGRPDLSAAGIISYLKPIHKEIGDKKINVEKMKALAPEIEQSKILVSSSILSPNDLQDGQFIFSFDNVPSIATDPDLAKEIAEVYEQFYNDTLELGIKSYDWIGDIQYGTGSKPILILPIATQEAVRNRTSKDIKKDQIYDFGPGFANFEEFRKKQSSDMDYFWSGKKYTWKDSFKNEAAIDIEEMVPTMEAFGVQVPTAYSTARKSMDSNLYGRSYLSGLEDMVVNLRTILSEGDVIKVSENPEILRFHQERKSVDKQAVFDKLAKMYDSQIVRNPIHEDTIRLDPNPEGIPHKGHPTIIELPSEAVIPIYVAGNPKEHLGYFVLIDDDGQPLTIEASGLGEQSNTGCNPGSSAAAFEAVFGKGCCGCKYFNQDNQMNNVGNMIFQHLLDNYIKSRVKGIFGRNDLTLSRFNAVATAMFYRLLKRKETTLVFVPPELLHYFAFQYDKNGVGISKLDEIEFLLSLRTTFLVANIMALAKDAVEQKKIEVGVDSKNANVLGLLDRIKNIFIAKGKLGMSIDPSEIMNDITTNSLTIVPKGVPGLEDITVDVTNNGSQSQRVDDNLMEQLTNLIVSHMDVPPAALNQLSEPEYAKSLVTYNLFFAKKITRYQRIWCAMMNEFIRAHSRFDPDFKAAILKKLQATGKKVTNENLPSKTKGFQDDNPNIYEQRTDKLLNDILDNVEVHLPTPNIVVDKAQFNEMRDFLSNLNEIADQFFNSELIPSEDQAAQAALPVLKAKWRKDQLTRFIEQVGSFTMVEPPDPDDLDLVPLTNFIQMLQNANAGLTKQREAIGNPPNGTYDQNNGGYGGGMDMGMGGDMGEDMGGDMDMGEGEDMGFDEGGADFTEEAPTEEKSEEENSSESDESNNPATMYYNRIKNRYHKK